MRFYIDPGTGSMLFSILIGVIGAAFYFLRGLLIKIKYSLNIGKAEKLSDSCLKYVIYSESRRYWNVFKPICDEFERRGIEVDYLTSDSEDPGLTEGYQHIRPSFIGEGNRGFAKLNLLNASIVLSTTPSLDVYQWKRSKNVKYYVHIAHMPNDITTYEMFGLDHYDAILLSGEYQIREIRELERLRELPEKDCELVGLPYMDAMRRRLEETGACHAEQKTVLLAPSWGKSGILSRFGERIIDPLISTGYNIVIRPHPQSFTSEKEMLQRLMERYPESEKLHWNQDRDNFEVLRRSDVLISDFSGVIFDYTLVFDKPVIYTDISSFDKSPYDAAWLDEELWTFRVLPGLGEQLTEENLPRIREVIDRVIADPHYRQARDRAREETWAYPGEGAARTVDYLVKKLDELNAVTGETGK